MVKFFIDSKTILEYDGFMDVKEIERSLLTKYRKDIYRPFTKAVFDYQLLEDGDKVCVCISGGKDSFLLAKCMQEFEKHGKVKIHCVFLVMDPGFSESHLKQIQDNAHKLNIPINIVKSNIFEAVKNDRHNTPCYVCAKMRRGFLYDNAQKLGCNKIALGHHFNDVIETTMLSILYNGVFNTMLPKVKSKHFQGMQLIRPLYLVHEDNILHAINYWGISFNECSCPLKKDLSKRKEIKDLIKEMKSQNRNVEYNIFRSSENVEINSIRGYLNQNNERINYLNKIK